MPSTANQGQPGSEQELDLANGAPSPGTFRVPLDRISMAVNVGNGFGGKTDIRLKGSLQRIVEFFAAVAGGAVFAVTAGFACRLGELTGPAVPVVSLAAGAVGFAAGIRYFLRQPAARDRSTDRRT